MAPWFTCMYIKVKHTRMWKLIHMSCAMRDHGEKSTILSWGNCTHCLFSHFISSQLFFITIDIFHLFYAHRTCTVSYIRSWVIFPSSVNILCLSLSIWWIHGSWCTAIGGCRNPCCSMWYWGNILNILALYYLLFCC
jgi:hypothetical protein